MKLKLKTNQIPKGDYFGRNIFTKLKVKAKVSQLTRRIYITQRKNRKIKFGQKIRKTMKPLKSKIDSSLTGYDDAIPMPSLTKSYQALMKHWLDL